MDGSYWAALLHTEVCALVIHKACSQVSGARRHEYVPALGDSPPGEPSNRKLNSALVITRLRTSLKRRSDGCPLTTFALYQSAPEVLRALGDYRASLVVCGSYRRTQSRFAGRIFIVDQPGRTVLRLRHRGSPPTFRPSQRSSVQALEADIRTWVKGWNEDPKPFIWTKTAGQILDRLKRLLQRTTGAGH